MADHRDKGLHDEQCNVPPEYQDKEAPPKEQDVCYSGYLDVAQIDLSPKEIRMRVFEAVVKRDDVLGFHDGILNKCELIVRWVETGQLE